MLKQVWNWIKEKVWWVLGVGTIAFAGTIVILPPQELATHDDIILTVAAEQAVYRLTHQKNLEKITYKIGDTNITIEVYDKPGYVLTLESPSLVTRIDYRPANRIHPNGEIKRTDDITASTKP